MSDFWMYDVAALCWTDLSGTKGPRPVGRYNMPMIAGDELLFMFGGEVSNENAATFTSGEGIGRRRLEHLCRF